MWEPHGFMAYNWPHTGFHEPDQGPPWFMWLTCDYVIGHMGPGMKINK